MSVDFNKKLADKNLKQLYTMLNREVTSLEDRLGVVDDICQQDFFKIYFDDIYNPHLTKNDELSIDNNVCVFLERAADYILLSDEEKQQRNQNETFYFTRRDRLMKRLERELSFSSILTNNTDLNDSILHSLHHNTHNSYIELKEVEVTKDDLERTDELGKILREYAHAIKRIDKCDDMNNMDKQHHKYLLVEDMKIIKKYYLGVSDYVYKCNMQKQHAEKSYLDDIDFSLNTDILEGVSIRFDNGRSIRLDGLLFIDSGGLNENDPLSFWVYELDSLIQRSELTERELYVLNRIRKKEKQSHIASDLQVSQQYVSKTYKKALEKIIKKNKQEECKNDNDKTRVTK